MARFRWSKTKLCKALWANIFWLPKIDKLMARSSSKKKWVVRKKSEYWVQLKEKQILRFMFWISESQLQKYYQKAVSSNTVTSEELIRQLETRIDNVLFRAWFAESRPQARQFIAHGHFELNWKKIKTPSIQVKKWDKITLKLKSKDASVFQEFITPWKILQWIKPDIKKKEILIESLPEWDELEQSVKVHLIVEYYSRR